LLVPLALRICAGLSSNRGCRSGVAYRLSGVLLDLCGHGVSDILPFHCCHCEDDAFSSLWYGSAIWLWKTNMTIGRMHARRNSSALGCFHLRCRETKISLHDIVKQSGEGVICRRCCAADMARQCRQTLGELTGGAATRISTPRVDRHGARAAAAHAASALHSRYLQDPAAAAHRMRTRTCCGARIAPLRIMK